MKSLFILTLIVLLGLVKSQAPTYIYTITSSGANVTLSIVDISTGDTVKQELIFTYPESFVFPLGVVQSNADGFQLIANNNFNNSIGLFSYSMSTNSVTSTSYSSNENYSIQIQPIGFNPTLGTSYIIGNSYPNITIIVFNFNTHQSSYINFESFEPVFGPIGCYDSVHNNYYFSFVDSTSFSGNLVTYNLNSKTLSPPVNISILGDNSYLFAASGMLYAVQYEATNSNLYTLDPTTGASKLVYTITSEFTVIETGFVNNDDYIVFITSNDNEQVMYTLVDLLSYQTISQSPFTQGIEYAYMLGLN